ncbi:MAG: FCD domain-containing protein [Geminicoccaceae bacterium]
MPKRVAADIAVSLRERIQNGEWRAASRLPTERDLARSYGVARNTVRRAIETVASEGLLSREVGRGTFLAGNVDRELRAMVSGIAGTSPADMMAVRMILEPRAAALAASNATAGHLQELAATHEAAVRADEMVDFERIDAELHELIFAASRNDLLRRLHDLLRLIRSQEPWLALKRRSFSPGRRDRYCTEHGRIIEALLRRDGEAAALAMRGHLETVSRNLFGDPL